ncbi:hypothetical protein LINPERPRIM_LOCUS22947, partial [Linum perenne]
LPIKRDIEYQAKPLQLMQPYQRKRKKKKNSGYRITEKERRRRWKALMEKTRPINS